jgi:hypothetical protein
MNQRLDAHNVSVDTSLAQAGACARIHLPSGRICALPQGDIADAGEWRPVGGPA